MGQRDDVQGYGGIGPLDVLKRVRIGKASAFSHEHIDVAKGVLGNNATIETCKVTVPIPDFSIMKAQ